MAMRWVSERDLLEPGVRLFCLPHAGSGAAGFYRWKRELAGRGVAVCPVMLPGREARIAEPLLTRVSTIVEALQVEVGPMLAERPFAVYGHSMSALLAFEWVRSMESQGLRPRVLLVGGRNAPQFGPGHRVFHAMPDEAMVRALVETYGGDAGVVLEDEDLREVFLPIIRADLEVVETYRYVEGAKVGCAVRAFAGASDGSVSVEGLDGWGDVTAGSFVGRRVVGDHFFHLGVGQEGLLEEIVKETVEGSD